MLHYKKMMEKYDMKKNNLLILISFFVITLIILIVLISSRIKNQDTTASSIEQIDYTQLLKQTNVYPHNQDSFTEGLFYYDGELYESSGLYEKSFLSKNINLSTGKAENTYIFPDDIFAEGCTILNDKLYVLTYKENKTFLFDKDALDLQKEYEYNHNREGWGLTTDGTYLITSDGSSHIYFMDEELNDVKSITVKLNGNEISNINELEYINGYIWANVWQTNYIIIIDSNTGNVVKLLDFSNLLTEDNKTDKINVLNGIAYNKQTNKIYITGKNWEKIFEFELI